MSQTQTQKTETQQTTERRVNFSDGNRTLHLQVFFTWLPDDLHDAPLIDWARVPSRLMGYLVNSVGSSPFAGSIALAAGAAAGALGEYTLLNQVRNLSLLLRKIRTLCGIERACDLTKEVWEKYLTEKDLTPGDYGNFKGYHSLTEWHLPEYLEQLDMRQYATVELYVLPRLPRLFLQQQVNSSYFHAMEKQRRKAQSDVLTPLHSILVALVQLRKQAADRLLWAYHEACERAKTGILQLPLSFSYEEEIVTINRDAQSVSEIHLEKRPVILQFRLWDYSSWIFKHKDDYRATTWYRAKCKSEEISEKRFFIECLNPTEDLLWFGDLIKYRLFQKHPPLNLSPEDTHRREDLLRLLNQSTGLACKREGLLTPADDFTTVLSHAMSRTGALVFEPEALHRGVLFGAALATIALTNGSRTCELLQISADRFKARPYVVKKAGNATGEERMMYLQLLLPKGKRTEEERQLFLISHGAYELLREIAQELRSKHDNHIPVVHPSLENSKVEDLSPERYLFQWNASSDGKWGILSPEDIISLLRFILYGLEFCTREGEPFSISVHLLRHVTATAARREHEVPPEAVARVLHHEHKPGTVPASTEYYSQETAEQELLAFAGFQTDVETRAASLLVRFPSEQEIADMDDDLRESFERWQTLLETTLGFCGNIDLCPRGYNRTLCVGCPHLVVDPRKRKIAEHWRMVYARLAKDLETQGNTVDARQYRLLVRDLDNHINEMDILQPAIDDGTRKPVFLQLPSAPYDEVIVDAQA